MTTKEELQKEHAELKAELDELKTRLTEADAKYRTYDQKLQQEGLSEDLKFLLTAAERQQTELRQRRDPLLARLTEIEKLLVSHSKAKRLRLVPETEKATVCGFINNTFLVRREDIDFDSKDQVDFLLPIWGFQQNREFLLKRKSTAALASSIVKEFLVKEPRPTIVLAGSKGIGKSCESLFLIKKFVEEDQLILFEYGNEKMLIATQKTLNLKRQALDEAFESFEEPPLERAGVYAFRPQSEDFFALLCKTFVHIVDVGDNYVGEIDVLHPQIIISSPNFIKLTRTGAVSQPLMRYLNPWTREELKDLNERLESLAQMSRDLPSSPHGQHLLVAKSPEELRELIKMFGGIPREIFNGRSVKDAESYIRKEVGSVSLDTWRTVLTQADYTKLPKMIPGVLVHITKDKHSENQCEVRFATSYVAKIVVSKYYQSQRNELFSLANSVKGENRLTAQLRGEMLQQRMHEILQQQPRELSIIPLLENGVQGARCVLKVPRLTLREFASNKMLDLGSLAENDYCVAMSSNFPSVESFLIVKKRLLGIDEDGLCIVGLQATTASTHPVKRKGLKDIIKRCHELLGLTLPLYVIFMTTQNGIQVRQSLGKRHEQFDDTVLQFRCTDVDFNEILTLFSVASTGEVSEEEESDNEV